MVLFDTSNTQVQNSVQIQLLKNVYPLPSLLKFNYYFFNTHETCLTTKESIYKKNDDFKYNYESYLIICICLILLFLPGETNK